MQPPHVYRLLEVIKRAFIFDRANRHVDRALAGQQNNSDVGMFLAQARQQLEAVELWHDDIGDDDQRREAIDALQRIEAIGSRSRSITPAGHQLAQALPRGFFIIDNEHTLLGHRKRVYHRRRSRC